MEVKKKEKKKDNDENFDSFKKRGKQKK